MTAHSQKTAAPNPVQRAFWLKQLHQWHWISASLSLLGMLMFSVTGITLNHATQIEARPRVENRKAVLPAALLPELHPLGEAGVNAALPTAVNQWLIENWSLDMQGREAEWSPEEAYLPLPRPGGDAWLRIAIDSGAVEYELTRRGWISWLNDLHKGRNTGTAWSWFLDVFAGACLLFSITGLLILKFHAANRPSTWPIVGLGVLIPMVLALLFIH